MDRGSVILMLASLLALIWLLSARTLGPSDLWDQAQPKTVSYTTDIMVHGGDRWILPRVRDEHPATKPPLYNWMAVPPVRLLGFSSEIAHKFPSILSVGLCWMIVVRLGKKLFGNDIGWLAGLCFVANYTIFKLGYLARPDMILVLWVLLAWYAATRLLIDKREGMPCGGNRVLVLRWLFWIAVALAGLTKGPVLLLPLLYAIIASRVIGGSFRSFHIFHWWGGGMFVVVICGAWVYGVWRIDPDHLLQVLWKSEILDRITGENPDINDHGFTGWLKSLPNMPFYFILRFLPWSPFAVFAMLRIFSWRTKNEQTSDTDSVEPGRTEKLWLTAAAIQVLMVIAVFSLSLGKRADYLSICFPQAALLAAWTGMTIMARFPRSLKWTAPALAFLTLVIMTRDNLDQSEAPSPDFARGITKFIDECTIAMDADPLPVPCCWMGATHLQALLGRSQGPELMPVGDLLRAGESCWVLLAWRALTPDEYADRIHQSFPDASIEEIVRSDDLPFAKGWVGRISMYRITPTSKISPD